MRTQFYKLCCWNNFHFFGKKFNCWIDCYCFDCCKHCKHCLYYYQWVCAIFFKMSTHISSVLPPVSLTQNQLKSKLVSFFLFCCFIDPPPPCPTSILNKYNWSILIKLYRNFNWRIWCFYDKQKCKFMLAFIMLIEIFQNGMQCTQIESEKERQSAIQPTEAKVWIVKNGQRWYTSEFILGW